MGAETDILPIIYAMLVGFAIAGLAMASFRLATGRALGFALENLDGSPLAVLSILLRIVAGPGILVSNALEAEESDWQVAIILGCLALAVGWSFLSGSVMIQSLTNFPVTSAVQPA